MDAQLELKGLVVFIIVKEKNIKIQMKSQTFLEHKQAL